MKKIILSATIVLMTMMSSARAQEGIINDSAQKSLIKVSYRLFPTQNNWNFIKLNTRNGQMWQVQFDVEGDNRFVTYLSILPLVDKEKEVDDRFTLYPTKNIWTFILLDQHDGRTWQVQWSMEPEYRGIFPIE